MFDPDDVRANRDWFAAKLRAERQRADVVRAIQAGRFPFVLLDTRGHEAFAAGHIDGAWDLPAEDVDRLAARLPKDRELVTYCWSHD